MENAVSKPFSCPCCGRKTLEARGHYDICPVCWWEDDGTDNENADNHSGPNHLTLAEGRMNFIKYGIYNPNRTDLMEKQMNAELFALGRVFRITENQVFEEKTDLFK